MDKNSFCQRIDFTNLILQNYRKCYLGLLMISNTIIMFHNYRLSALIAIAILVPTITIATTTLTTSNCPSSYDLTTANSSASADSSAESLVGLIYGGLYSAQDQAALSLAYTQGDTKTVKNYLYSMQIIVPFLIIGIGFAVVFIAALLCCVFEKSCPPCHSWKRDFSSRPYEKFELNCAAIFTLIFAAAITIASIVGFVFFPALQQDLKMTKCALYYSVDVALNGDQNNQNNGWGGFIPLTQRIGNISDHLSTVSTAASANLSNSDWLVTDLTDLRQANINLYTNNNESTVYSPNPSTTASAISANTALPTVVPLFISSGLGPYTTNNTMTFDIDQGILNTTAVVAAQGYNVYLAAQTLTNSANNIQTNTNINLQSLSMNSNYFDASITSLNNFSADVFDSLFDWALYLIEAILVFVMVASILTLLGAISTHFCEMYSCKNCVHLGWVTFGVTYFGILAMCFFFFAMGGLSYSFCQFYGGIITSQTTYSAFTDTSSPTSFNRIFSKLGVCFYGNGSIISAFLLKNEIQTVSQLYAQINTYLAMQDSSSSTYVNLTYSTNKINRWISAMQQYRSGVYIDASPGLTTEDNPQIALQGMNKYTNNGTGGVIPTCTFDYWVFDKVNCTQSTGQVAYNDSTNNSGTTFSSSGYMCISFNSKFSSNSSSNWTQRDIANRYIQLRQCQNSTQAYDSIMQYADSLINYRDSRINLYQNLQDQLTAVLNKNTAFNTKVASFTNGVREFYNNTLNLRGMVASPGSGVDYSSNCTVIADNLRALYNIFCVGFISKSVQFGVCCLVLLAIMIGGMLTGSVLGIRYGRLDKEKRTVVPMPEAPLSADLHSETFEKRQKSSDSSSSDND